jgi:dienelactone hydrolase
MAEVVLYHHVQGLTEGVRSFAEELRQAGHTVHTPELFGGRTFETIEEGLAFAREAGFGTLAERGVAAAAGIDPASVYAGFSFGVIMAQQLAQTRPGARGALLLHSCIPPEEFGPWPEDLPAQIHMMERDEWVLPPNDDLAVARGLHEAGRAQLFLYPGDRHLFAEPGHPDYDEGAAALMTRRALNHLAELG